VPRCLPRYDRGSQAGARKPARRNWTAATGVCQVPSIGVRLQSDPELPARRPCVLLYAAARQRQEHRAGLFLHCWGHYAILLQIASLMSRQQESTLRRADLARPEGSTLRDDIRDRGGPRPRRREVKRITQVQGRIRRPGSSRTHRFNEATRRLGSTVNFMPVIRGYGRGDGGGCATIPFM